MARFKSALAFYPTFFRCGGWIALGGLYLLSLIQPVPSADTCYSDPLQVPARNPHVFKVRNENQRRNMGS